VSDETSKWIIPLCAGILIGICLTMMFTMASTAPGMAAAPPPPSVPDAPPKRQIGFRRDPDRKPRQ